MKGGRSYGSVSISLRNLDRFETPAFGGIEEPTLGRLQQPTLVRNDSELMADDSDITFVA